MDIRHKSYGIIRTDDSTLPVLIESKTKTVRFRAFSPGSILRFGDSKRPAMNSKTYSLLTSDTQTFSAMLVRLVRERRAGNAPYVYNAAWINRRTWSAIVTDPDRPVAKRTAIQFALSLHLDCVEANRLLNAAGYALSPAIKEDAAFAYCFEQRIFDLFKVNEILYDRGLKIIPPV